MKNIQKTTLIVTVICAVAFSLIGTNTVFADSLNEEEIEELIIQASKLKKTIDEQQLEFDEMLKELNSYGIFLSTQPESDVEKWQQESDLTPNTKTNGYASKTVFIMGCNGPCESDDKHDKKAVIVKAAYKFTKNYRGFHWDSHVKGDWSAPIFSNDQGRMSVEVKQRSDNFQPYLIVKDSFHNHGSATATFTGTTTLQDSKNKNLNVIKYYTDYPKTTQTFVYFWDKYTSPYGATQAHINAGNFVVAEIKTTEVK